jgi:hypothetical protein
LKTRATSLPRPPRRPITLPLLVWLLPQLIALALAACRVPFSAGFPRPTERAAVVEMVITQFVAAGMLFPFILRDRNCFTAAALTAAPMLQFAGFLAATPIRDLFFAWACLVIWMAALALVADARPAPAPPSRTQFLLVASANLLTFGGLLLTYLDVEFSRRATVSRYFPLSGTLQFLSSGSIDPPLASTAIVAGVALAVFAFRRRSPVRLHRRAASSAPDS